MKSKQDGANPAASDSALFPIERAEELIGMLPGVENVRILPGVDGELEEIRVQTAAGMSPIQTARSIEGALLAQLGMRVSHRKISVTANDTKAPEAQVPNAAPKASVSHDSFVLPVPDGVRRKIYFEDVEARRSRTSGLKCKVTLRRGHELFVGEADAQDGERMRPELPARAALAAVMELDGAGGPLTFEGAKLITAFDREFVFVALSAREGRDVILLTGSAEVRDSIETASVLAVLDATNRWMEL